MTKTIDKTSKLLFALALAIALCGVGAVNAFAYAGLEVQSDPPVSGASAIDVSGATVTLSQTSVVFDGSEQKPTPTVVLGGITLSPDTDYTIAYAGNVNVGEATCTITGKGSYSGTAKATFAITAASLASAKVSAAAVTYTGSALTPAPTVVLGSTTLKQNVDYTVTYSANTKVGTASMKVTGKGNYKDFASGTFKITAKPINKAKVKAPSKVYTGKALKPVVTVTLGGATLKATRDYTISYRNAAGKAIKATSLKKAATYTVVVKGAGNYAGTATGTYKIKPTSLKGAKFTVKNKTYTGAVIRPSLKVVLGKTRLKLNRDYTVYYLNSAGKKVKASKLKAAGWYKIVVTGTGNYKGTKKVKFGIYRKELTKAKVKVKNATYTGSEITPNPKVTLGGKKLKKNRDYVLKYAHNVNAGTAKLKVTGVGNYKRSVIATFTIKPRSLSSATVSGVKNKTYTGDDIEQPKLVVRLDGKKLARDTDYEVGYKDNVDVGTATVVVKGKKNYKGKVAKTFEIKQRSLSKADVSGIYTKAYTGLRIYQDDMRVEVNDRVLDADKDYAVSYSNNRTVGTAKMTVRGKGNYKGSFKRTFDIEQADISNVDVMGIGDKTYTGRSITPLPFVTYYDKKLVAGSDYTREYHNNVMPGRATIILTGRGNFTGQKVVYFYIVRKTSSSTGMRAQADLGQLQAATF